MNIIEWLNKNYDATDAILPILIAFPIWFIFWKMLSKLFVKHQMYSLLEIGAIGSFGILIFLSLIVVLFIASIQVAIVYGIKMLFMVLLFWGALTTFAVLIIKYIKK